jgi:hypothetical protein
MAEHAPRPVACLAVVAFLSFASWTGAVWIAELLIREILAI